MDAQELIARYKAGERDFPGVDLSEVQLTYTHFPNINLSNANLSGVNFLGADLSVLI